MLSKQSTFQVGPDHAILLDGRDTGLKISQTACGSIVYVADLPSRRQKYRTHALPSPRYSTAHVRSASCAAGVIDLERDVCLLSRGWDTNDVLPSILPACRSGFRHD